MEFERWVGANEDRQIIMWAEMCRPNARGNRTISPAAAFRTDRRGTTEFLADRPGEY